MMELNIGRLYSIWRESLIFFSWGFKIGQHPNETYVCRDSRNFLEIVSR